ncbi:acyl-CoA dehydrogenase family protein [Gordonia sp. CPCC 206044]|uniref:acyl-CoA dehydrogenase family protein n=1 Tax=Gordonia sp. CPCC 206044 TaxID=3140793 RepID=UPI003AF408C8
MTIDDAESRRIRLVEDAYRIADDVLFPGAAEVDRSGLIPRSHWEQIADAGLFGIAAPAESDGPGLDFSQVIEIQEVMASGCLPTAFTWLQHHGVVISLAGSLNEALRTELLESTTTGRLRAGVAYAGVVPTPPRMRATRIDGGWRLDGRAPFVSGWGLVDLLQISARDVVTDDVIAAVLPLDPAPSAITATPQHLGVADATSTVTLVVDGLTVSDESVVSRTPLDDFFASQNIGIRINGTLPLGLVRRCAALLDTGGHAAAARALRERGGEIRTRLDNALTDTRALVAARADAAQLATDAAATTIAAAGGAGLLRGNHPERLSREAAFTLVAASRPELKDLLVERFSIG